MVRPSIVGIVGKSDSGKTTLIEKLVPELNRRGLRVGTVKHDVHGFEMDREGKDSYRHKHSGARISLISSPSRIGMVRDVERDHTVKELAERYFDDVDLILTEGYKREHMPKVEVHRKELMRGLLSSPEDGLIALATNEPLPVEVPSFDLDDTPGLTQFLIDYFQLKSGDSGHEK